jgi:hypothetical protein
VKVPICEDWIQKTKTGDPPTDKNMTQQLKELCKGVGGNRDFAKTCGEYCGEWFPGQPHL